MKPKELRALTGRTVDVWYDGERTGVVKGCTMSDHLLVQFLGTYGRRQVPLDKVRGVFWYGKLVSVREMLALDAERKERKRCLKQLPSPSP